MENNNKGFEKESFVSSEGEKFLEEFLRNNEIKFDREVKIEKLKQDSRSYRVADFYLPKYKVYIEFFGLWNTSDENRNSYKEKMNVYRLNRIPCIYIFPENLGIIQFSFTYRLKKELERHNLKKELFKYNIKLLIDERRDEIVLFIFMILLFILFQFDRKAEWYWQSCMVVGFIAAYQLYKIAKSYYIFQSN